VQNKHNKIFIFRRVFKAVFILSVFFITSCQHDSDKKRNNKIETYWTDFDFKNKKLIEHPELIKQPVLSFLGLLNQYSQQESKHALESFMGHLLTVDTSIVKFTVDEVFEKFLYRAESPIRNENYYLSVVDCLIKSDRISPLDKDRFEFQKKMITLNLVGNVANNFRYITNEGKYGELADIEATYLLIYFNNPDCHECKRVKGLLENSDEINYGLQTKQLVILSVYPDSDMSTWKKTIYPVEWISSYDVDQSIVNNSLYDLRAIPCLYLLDKDKRVLIKDGVLEDILYFLDIKFKHRN